MRNKSTAHPVACVIAWILVLPTLLGLALVVAGIVLNAMGYGDFELFGINFG